jgi:hypothetical protein
MARGMAWKRSMGDGLGSVEGDAHLAAGMEQLAENLGAVRMHRVGHQAKAFDVRIVGDRQMPAGLVDDRALGQDQAGAALGALGVIGRQRLVGHIGPGQARVVAGGGDPVADRHALDRQGREQAFKGHRRSRRCERHDCRDCAKTPKDPRLPRLFSSRTCQGLEQRFYGKPE